MKNRHSKTGTATVTVMLAVMLVTACSMRARAQECFSFVPCDSSSNQTFGNATAIADDLMVVGAGGDDLGLGAVYVYRRYGPTWVQEQKLEATDKGQFNRSFGTSVATDGTRILVGANYTAGEAPGVAYVFSHHAAVWCQEQILQGGDTQVGDGFGHTVVIDGDWAVIGAYTDNNGSGSAYVFHRESEAWVEVQHLFAADFGDSLPWYGRALSLQADRLAVGGVASGSAGAVYLYRLDGQQPWAAWQRISAPACNTDGGQLFGTSVSIDGARLAAGAARCGAPDVANASGMAFLFEESGGTWTPLPVAVLSPFDANTRDGNTDEFGNAIALDGDRVVVASHRHQHDLPEWQPDDAGAAYVFERDLDSGAWLLTHELVQSNPGKVTNASFATSLAMKGGLVLIGAPEDDHVDEVDAGACYLFDLAPGGCTQTYEPLQISAVIPPMGPLAGGNTVTILGSGFTPGTRALFGDAPCVTTIVDTTTLMVIVPPLSPPFAVIRSAVDVTLVKAVVGDVCANRVEDRSCQAVLPAAYSYRHLDRP